MYVVDDPTFDRRWSGWPMLQECLFRTQSACTDSSSDVDIVSKLFICGEV